MREAHWRVIKGLLGLPALRFAVGTSDAESVEVPEKTLHILGIARAGAEVLRDQVVAKDSGSEGD